MDVVSRAVRSRMMAAVKSKDTVPELVVRRLVHAMGFRFRLHARRLPGAPDLVLPRHRLVIFVSGCFWHMHHCGRCRIPATNRKFWVTKLANNVARDRRVQRALRRAGWRVIVVWECQTLPAKRPLLEARLARLFVAQ